MVMFLAIVDVECSVSYWPFSSVMLHATSCSGMEVCQVFSSIACFWLLFIFDKNFERCVEPAVLSVFDSFCYTNSNKWLTTTVDALFISVHSLTNFCFEVAVMNVMNDSFVFLIYS